MAASKQTVNRRGFLKRGGTAAVGAAAVGGAGHAPRDAAATQADPGRQNPRRRAAPPIRAAQIAATRDAVRCGRRGPGARAAVRAGFGPDGAQVLRTWASNGWPPIPARASRGSRNRSSTTASSQRQAGVHHRVARGVHRSRWPTATAGRPALLMRAAATWASSPRTAPTIWPAWLRSYARGTPRSSDRGPRHWACSAPTTRR